MYFSCSIVGMALPDNYYRYLLNNFIKIVCYNYKEVMAVADFDIDPTKTVIDGINVGQYSCYCFGEDYQGMPSIEVGVMAAG